jgi:hypothetical protein
MAIKKYEVTILHEAVKTKQYVYATDVIINNGMVFFHIDAEVHFACPVQLTIMKKLELNKEITKNAATLSNSLLKII